MQAVHLSAPRGGGQDSQGAAGAWGLPQQRGSRPSCADPGRPLKAQLPPVCHQGAGDANVELLKEFFNNSGLLQGIEWHLCNVSVSLPVKVKAQGPIGHKYCHLVWGSSCSQVTMKANQVHISRLSDDIRAVSCSGDAAADASDPAGAALRGEGRQDRQHPGPPQHPAAASLLGHAHQPPLLGAPPGLHPRELLSVIHLAFW